ncbi:hypothetical protein V6N13_049882 [Hibiscus sabdariffa]
MSSNYFSGFVPDTLGNFRNLKRLNLEANHLTSSGMSFLSSLTNCKGLELLAFDNNPLISGELPGLVGNLSSSLLRFYASGCDIRGSIPSEIGKLKELQSLSLQDNNNLLSLRNLFLGSNMFSSSIPSTLTVLNDLLILNLSSNSLSGALPIDIGKWKVLTNIDLSNNQFSGDIPTGVADLKDLTHFSLSNNRITDFKEKFPREGHLESIQRNHLRRIKHYVVHLNFMFQAANLFGIPWQGLSS